MKDRTLNSTIVALADAGVALLAVVFFSSGHEQAARGPSQEIANQPVVTAPPLAAARDAARTQTSVMGGPPNPGHASR